MTRITRANGCPDGTLENAVVALDGGANYPREILGNKGHGIDMMRRHHLPVPPAFCITTEVGVRYLAAPESTIAAIWDDVLDRMSWLETETSCTFGRGPNPLLVSVRSGATQSMPGMMDTILDVGMTDAVERVLARPGAADFAHDTRRRFTSMYRRIVGSAGPITDDPYAQLRASIEAVFASWNSPRAVAYRDHHGLDDQGGTAVVVLLFGALYPNLVPSTLNPQWSLTIHNASSTPYTLKIMTWVTAFFAPLTVAYQTWTYWVFRQRISAERIPPPTGLARRAP